MNKKLVWIGGLLILVLLGGVWVFYYESKYTPAQVKPEAVSIQASPPAAESESPKSSAKPEATRDGASAAPKPTQTQNEPSRQASPTPPLISASPTENTDGIRIALAAGKDSYAANVPSGSTVYEAMEVLAVQTSFKFKSKYFPGLGYLIDEINGVRNAGGKYWMLYVNKKFATLGASQYKLSAGDSVEWRYESQ